MCVPCVGLQAEASWHARPRFEGLDLDAWVSSLDVLPWALPAEATPLDPLSTGQPLRARLGGAVKMSLRPLGWEADEGGGAEPTSTVSNQGQAGESLSAAARRARCIALGMGRSVMFEGELLGTQRVQIKLRRLL
jgi:hypothetical protein